MEQLRIDDRTIDEYSRIKEFKKDEAYVSIYEILRKNEDPLNLSGFGDQDKISTQLISALPEPGTEDDFDIYSISSEIIFGLLKGGINRKDDLGFRLGDYAIGCIIYYYNNKYSPYNIEQFSGRKHFKYVKVVKVDHLLQLAQDAFYTGKKEFARNYINDAHNLIGKTIDDENKNNLSMQIPLISAQMYYSINDNFGMENSLNHASQIRSLLDDKEVDIIVYAFWAIYYEAINDVDNAYDYYQKSINSSKDFLPNYRLSQDAYDMLDLSNRKTKVEELEDQAVNRVDIEDKLESKDPPNMEKNSWIFQALNRFDLTEKITPEHVEPWRVTRYKKEIQKGDIVYLWQAGEESVRGIHGWAVIFNDPYNSKVENQDEVYIGYKVKYENPILIDVLRQDEILCGLQIIKTPQGTNFKITEVQDKALDRLLIERGEVPPIKFLENESKDDPEQDTDAPLEPENHESAVDLATNSDMFSAEDYLGYKHYIDAIKHIILNRKEEHSLTIGIKAPWGAGKTTIMKQLEKEINDEDGSTDQKIDLLEYSIALSHLKDVDEDTIGRIFQNKFMPNKDKVHTTWFNPWKYQNKEQVWAGLAHSIITSITDRLNPVYKKTLLLFLNMNRKDSESLKKYASRWLFLYRWSNRILYPLLGLTIIAFAVIFLVDENIIHISIPSITTIGTALAGFVTKIKAKTENIFKTYKELTEIPDYESKMGFMHEVEKDIRVILNLTTSKEQPMVIFIDDLDRCEPCRVAEVMHALNLFLSGDYNNCVFVLGMDPDMVAAALEVANEDVIKKLKQNSVHKNSNYIGTRFMEKFVQLPITIPPPTKEGLTTMLEKITVKNSPGTEKDKRFAYFPGDYKTNENIEHTNLNQNDIDDKTRTILDPRPAKNHDMPEVKGLYVGEVVENKEERIKQLEEIEEKFKDLKSLSEIEHLRDKLCSENEDLSGDIKDIANKRYALILDKDEGIIRNKALDYRHILGDNPRQIKRFVNQFRILKYVNFANKSEYGGVEGFIPDDDTIAKFVVLTMVWPETTNLLKHEVISDGTFILNYLEKEAIKMNNNFNWKEDWENLLLAQDINPECSINSKELITFLAKPPYLHKYSNSIFW